MRPRSPCRIRYIPKWRSFRPEGCPDASLRVVELTAEETESIRLRNIRQLSQTRAAANMGISQSTYQRILTRANRKIARALIKGEMIRILGRRGKENNRKRTEKRT